VATQKFTGVIPPVVVPDTEDHQLDVASFERSINRMIDAGVDGLFFLGSSGEVVFSTDERRRQIIAEAVRIVDHRVPVLVGIIDTETERMIEQGKVAQELGADALVATCPFYALQGMTEVEEHFRILHEELDLPIFAYDIPVCVHTKLPWKLLAKLGAEGVLAGVKDSSGDDVSFRYETADRDAVSHASFEIARGRVVAVVGGTGSGKSTMSGLLARFYDPREGRITMDGVDLRDLHVADLRALVGSVMQETLLFNDTIEENIKYGSPDATHEQIVAAAKMANAHDFIMAQPEGYARNVGEKGFALSGGERQRIAIARAILRNPPILILDEATSALDTVTERLVQDAIDNLMKDRTTFAIAHRLSTIRNADLILVMQGGRIVERGTHAELFAANGVYRKLCDMQKTN